jgi:hypothetical protein
VADPDGQVDELETLRAELEERNRIIAELQQGEGVSKGQRDCGLGEGVHSSVFADRVKGYTVLYWLIG